MKRPASVPRCLCAFAAAALIAREACAGEIHIGGGRCASNVHLVAKDASLSDVLNRLSKVLGFELVNYLESDPTITVDTTRRPVDLIAGLVPDNVSMTLGSDPRCRNGERILKVWVLSTEQGRTAAARPRRSAEEEAQALREREGIETVLRAHGMPITGGDAAAKAR